MRYKILNLFIIFLFTITVAISAPVNSLWLSDLENNFFGVDYPKDSELNRVIRIEKVLYGSEQKGTIESRINKIANDTGSVYKKKETPQQKKPLDIPINTNNPQSQTAQNQNSPIAQYGQEDSTVDYPIVDKMEKKVFNTTYPKENIYKRLDRLETKVFNSTSKGALNSRVERLSDALLYNEKTAQKDDNGYRPYPSQMPKTTDYYGQNYTGTYSDNNISVQLAALERNNLRSLYTSDSVGQRLNRLETAMLGKTFPQDNASVRVERLMAVNMANNSSAMYDNNKMMRNVTTFSQIGGILLMILAMIL